MLLNENLICWKLCTPQCPSWQMHTFSIVVWETMSKGGVYSLAKHVLVSVNGIENHMGEMGIGKYILTSLH